jgi:hypothetical protein
MWTAVTRSLFLTITRAIVPPTRTPKMTPTTYLVLYSDGTCAQRILLPVEIERWVARCNTDTHRTRRILRIIDTKGNIVWEKSLRHLNG